MSTQDNRSERQKLITALSELQKKYNINDNDIIPNTWIRI